MRLQFPAVKKFANVITVTSVIVLAGGYTTLHAQPESEVEYEVIEEGVVPFYEVINVSADTLNIHKLPNFGSDEIGSVSANQRCVGSLNLKSGQWIKITHQGKQGWVKLDFLRRDDQGCGTYYRVGDNVREFINLRKLPEFPGEKLGTIPKHLPEGEEKCFFGVDKLTKNNVNWVLVQYKEIIGWVNSYYTKEIDVDDCDI